MTMLDKVTRYEPEVVTYVDLKTTRNWQKLHTNSKQAFEHLQFSTHFVDGSTSQKESLTIARVLYDRAVKALT